MNLLQNIFFEYFSDKYYQNNYWRAYIEYIWEKNNWFSWKICFFHFNLQEYNINWLNNLEILKFIKLFYSNAYSELYVILKYCIKNNIVVSINSFNEYEFIIKFWNENIKIRNLILYLLKRYSKKQIIIDNNKNIRFFELHINLKNKFFIERFKIYTEIFWENGLLYQKWYLDKDNVFMKLDIINYNLTNNEITKWLLIKLINPIKFSESKYLLNNFSWESMNIFNKTNIYLWFIEKWVWDDLIYFTEWYSIKA